MPRMWYTARMKGFMKKILKKKHTAPEQKAKSVHDTANAVFDQYKKSFKDLARYDREGKVPAN